MLDRIFLDVGRIHRLQGQTTYIACLSGPAVVLPVSQATVRYRCVTRGHSCEIFKNLERFVISVCTEEIFSDLAVDESVLHVELSSQHDGVYSTRYIAFILEQSCFGKMKFNERGGMFDGLVDERQ